MNGIYFPSSTYPKENIDKSDNIDEKRDISTSNLNKILENNKNKKVTIYCSFPDKNNKSFEGVLEDVQDDYLVISEPATDKWIVIISMYLNYIEFDEKINI